MLFTSCLYLAPTISVYEMRFHFRFSLIPLRMIRVCPEIYFVHDDIQLLKSGRPHLHIDCHKGEPMVAKNEHPNDYGDNYPNSRKIYVDGKQGGVRVPLREIHLSPTSGIRNGSASRKRPAMTRVRVFSVIISGLELLDRLAKQATRAQQKDKEHQNIHRRL